MILHNNDPDDVEDQKLKSGSGLGYEGLKGGALIVEFDFHADKEVNGEPSYPHLSV